MKNLELPTNGWHVNLYLSYNLNSTLKCNLMTGCERCGAAVGSVLFSPTKMMSTNETLQPAHAGTKIHNIFDA